MLKVRSLCIGAMLCAAAAMAALSLLPAEHLHTSDSGATVVHRHADDGATEHPGAAFHDGDDHSAETIERKYVASRHYDLGRPLIDAGRVCVTSEPRVVSRVDALEILMTHGPPIRFGPPLRAPPA